MTYLATLDLPVTALRKFPGNAKQGDVPKIRESLRRNAQYRSVVVRADDATDPSKGGTVLAGNNTLQAAIEEGWEQLRCEVIACDEETGKRINLADNRLSDIGDYDHRLLAELLADLEDTSGTGYDPQDIDNLATLVGDDGWDDGTPGSSKASSAGEPDDALFWPRIDMRVPPEVFDAWRTTLDKYDGEDDVAKLTAHVRALGHL